jgi:hypothetical protein
MVLTTMGLRTGATTAVEDVVEAMRRESDGEVRTPFWLDAVLATCRHAEDLPHAVRHFRKIAGPLRQTRREMEFAILRNDRSELAKLRRAVDGTRSRTLRSFRGALQRRSVCRGWRSWRRGRGWARTWLH